MRLIRGCRTMLEYGLFVAALVPTLLVLLAAVICLRGGDAAPVVTTHSLPIYRTS